MTLPIPPLKPLLFLCWQREVFGLRFVLLLCACLLPLVLSLACPRDENWVSYSNSLQDPLGGDGGCSSHVDGVGTGSSPACAALKRVCAQSGPFCFPSTFLGSLDLKDKFELCSLETPEHLVEIANFDSRWFSDHTVHTLEDGGKVTCSVVDSDGGSSDGLEDVNVCEGPLPSEISMQGSNGIATFVKSSVFDDSLPPYVEINPTTLDWGSHHLYSTSFAFLTMVNTHNDSILHIYQPFSTNTQFYPHAFHEMSIVPGKTVSIPFVFLPQLLGSSSAHIVLQTSFGGFVINARGTAVESSYGIQSLVEFDVSGNGRLHKNFSLYNPYNDMLYVNEATAWVSVVSGNVSRSSRIVCHRNSIQEAAGGISSSIGHYEMHGSKRIEPSLVGLKPHMKWELLPHSAETILEVNLLPHMEGNVSGFVCLKLQTSSQSKNQMVLIPLEAKMHQTVGYHASTGLNPVLLEPIVHNCRGSIFVLSMRNGLSRSLQVLKVSEKSDGKKIFNIRYTEGLILYVGTFTQVAFVTYTPSLDSQGIPLGAPCENLNCILQIVTNYSDSPQTSIPCRDLLYSCSADDRSVSDISEDKYSDLSSENESADGGSLSSSFSVENSLTKSNLLEVFEADELILRNWKYQGSMVEMSVLVDHELLFPMVEVGSHISKWLTLKNPSSKPVIVQILLSSGSLIDHCKPTNDHYIMASFSGIRSTETLDGFSFGKTAITEALMHPSGVAMFGPILFHPSDRCTWRSSIIIRNNLSGVEWLPIHGIGGSHSLVILEESKSVQKLEFDIEPPPTLNDSSREPSFHMERQSSHSCSHILSKDLLLKNTGELSLEVIKLLVSGTSCHMDGFTVHTCKAFVLRPGESTFLQISYQADFTSSLVQRDLELSLPSGIVVIPMKARIPFSTLKLCRKSLVWSLMRMLLLLAFVALSVLALFFYFPTTLASTYDDYLIKSSETVVSKGGKRPKIHGIPRNHRFPTECQKSSVDVAGGYSVCTGDAQDDTRKAKAKPAFDYEDKPPISQPCSKAKEPDVSESPQVSNLTVRVVKERGKRRRKRASGPVASLAYKNEVSSSQSGNSTPSSPLSPNILTPKQACPFSPNNALESRVVHENNLKKNMVHKSLSDAINEPVSMESYRNMRQPVARDWPLDQPTVKPVLLPSATFPASGCRSPGVTNTNFFAATSPIAPHARAPGSRLSKDKETKRVDEPTQENKFIYDIWGNHLADHIMGRSKELSSRPFSDASEGNSLSFFARGPQSLVKMSSARSVSPGSRLPSYDVNYNHQMV